MSVETSEDSVLQGYIDNAAPVLALQFDAQQRVLTVNAHALRVLGDGLIGRSLRDLVVSFTPVPDLSTLQANHANSYLLSMNTCSRMPESYRFCFFPQSGGWLALGSLDVEEQLRLSAEVLNLNRELNDLTRQLHLANADLRELNQLKNRFLGMAAHDLRKPIGLIMTYGEFVLDEAGAALSDEHRGFLKTCLVAATDMKRLIDNFLDVSIIESGALRLDRSPVSFATILAGVAPILQVLAAKKNIHLQMDCGKAKDDTMPVRVDCAKVQQVLLNLVGNAVEHSIAESRVWVCARWVDQALECTVRDEGPGIELKDQARLFTAFTRTGTSKTAGERSIGLGLSIARLVVEAHGGRIWVESTPGEGARFKFTLPIDSQQKEVAAS